MPVFCVKRTNVKYIEANSTVFEFASIYLTLVRFTQKKGTGVQKGSVVSPCSIMVHHGFTSKDVKRAGYATSITLLNFLLPAKVMYPVNSTKRLSCLSRSTPIFIVEECLNICIYMCVCV